MNVYRYNKYLIRLTSIHILKCSMIEKVYEDKVPHYWVRLLESKDPYIRGERFYTNSTNLINVNGTKTDKNNKS